MGKQNVYDHSVHVPLIISGPGIPRGKIREQLCYIYDIYPTLCEKAGLRTPETVEFKSLNGALNSSEAKHRDYLYYAFMSTVYKLGNALSVACAYFILDLVGFDPTSTNDPAAVTGLLFTFALLPALFAGLAALCMWGYPLDKQTHESIRRRLAEIAPTSSPTQ